MATNQIKNMNNTKNRERREVIQIGPKLYVFPRLPFETDRVYFARRNFLNKFAPKTQKQFMDGTRLSMIWANIRFLGVSYSPEVNKELQKVIQVFT